MIVLPIYQRISVDVMSTNRPIQFQTPPGHHFVDNRTLLGYLLYALSIFIVYDSKFWRALIGRNRSRDGIVSFSAGAYQRTVPIFGNSR